MSAQKAIRPKNLLTRRQALARAIELQRREALKHHIVELLERIEKLKGELEDMKIVDEVDEETLRSRIEDDLDLDSESDSDDYGGMEEVIMIHETTFVLLMFWLI